MLFRSRRERKRRKEVTAIERKWVLPCGEWRSLLCLARSCGCSFAAACRGRKKGTPGDSRLGRAKLRPARCGFHRVALDLSQAEEQSKVASEEANGSLQAPPIYYRSSVHSLAPFKDSRTAAATSAPSNSHVSEDSQGRSWPRPAPAHSARRTQRH